MKKTAIVAMLVAAPLLTGSLYASEQAGTDEFNFKATCPTVAQVTTLLSQVEWNPEKLKVSMTDFLNTIPGEKKILTTTQHDQNNVMIHWMATKLFFTKFNKAEFPIGNTQFRNGHSSYDPHLQVCRYTVRYTVPVGETSALLDVIFTRLKEDV